MFALPAPYGAFATQGWTINWDFFGKGTEYYVLNPGAKTYGYLVKDEYDGSVMFAVKSHIAAQGYVAFARELNYKIMFWRRMSYGACKRKTC